MAEKQSNHSDGFKKDLTRRGFMKGVAGFFAGAAAEKAGLTQLHDKNLSVVGANNNEVTQAQQSQEQLVEQRKLERAQRTQIEEALIPSHQLEKIGEFFKLTMVDYSKMNFSANLDKIQMVQQHFQPIDGSHPMEQGAEGEAFRLVTSTETIPVPFGQIADQLRITKLDFDKIVDSSRVSNCVVEGDTLELFLKNGYAFGYGYDLDGAAYLVVRTFPEGRDNSDDRLAQYGVLKIKLDSVDSHTKAVKLIDSNFDTVRSKVSFQVGGEQSEISPYVINLTS